MKFMVMTNTPCQAHKNRLNLKHEPICKKANLTKGKSLAAMKHKEGLRGLAATPAQAGADFVQDSTKVTKGM